MLPFAGADTDFTSRAILTWAEQNDVAWHYIDPEKPQQNVFVESFNVVEHGPWHTDEITVLVNGGNGGWDPRPNTAGRSDCPGNYCGYSPNQEEGMNRFERDSFMPMTDLETYPDAMKPIWDNNGWSQGLRTITFLTGEQWGDWDGHMAVGLMGIGFGGTPFGQRIDVVELDEHGTSVVDVTEMTLPMDSGRFRSLVQGPDGSLYAAVDEGTIHRLTPN